MKLQTTLPFLLLTWISSASFLFAAPNTTPSGGEATVRVELTEDTKLSESQGMLWRSLFGNPGRAVHLGAQGVGTFDQEAVLSVPVDLPKAGQYFLSLEYALRQDPANENREVSVSVGGVAPPRWQKVVLRPTFPYLTTGARGLYVRDGGLVRWTFEGSAMLRAGKQTLQIRVNGGDILFRGITLTTGQPRPTERLDMQRIEQRGLPVPEPKNPDFWSGYVRFPALDFSKREDFEAGGKKRITFYGTFTNLAPVPVRYEISTRMLPRTKGGADLYRVVSVQPPKLLQLTAGGTAAFSLTVESLEPLPPQASQLVELQLSSLDIPNLKKPYLMAASNGYLEIPKGPQFPTRKHRVDSPLTVVPGVDPRFVIPGREHLGLKDGNYERSLGAAFREALSSSPGPVQSAGRRGGGTKGGEFQVGKDGEFLGGDMKAWANDKRTPEAALEKQLTVLLGGMGNRKASDTASVKALLLRLADEHPYYPVTPHWESQRPETTTGRQWPGENVGPVAAYIRLVQEADISDDEHFRFLHNVILPYLLLTRDDFRTRGTLSGEAKAGQTLDQIEPLLKRDAPPLMAPLYSGFGAYIILGEGEDAEFLGANKVLERNHPAGTPWVSYYSREATILEGTESWPASVLAVASRDSEVRDNSLRRMNDVLAMEELYREDGSFREEPGSYGMGGYHYIGFIEELSEFLPEDFAVLDAETKRRMFLLLCHWGEFPFSDGTSLMLNQRGSLNPVPRRTEALDLMERMFPEEKETLQRFRRIAEQEEKRTPGSMVENRSFKIEGWGYAMLRGPGPWDRRIETLVASKRGVYDPAHHMSRDSMSLWIFAHGGIMTPRYGYHWINPPQLVMYNQVTIPDTTPEYWGEFWHFDDNAEMPSAVVFTDMQGPYSHEPGAARQERWVVQLREYVFDFYQVKHRKPGDHKITWGYRNMGAVSIVTPENAKLEPVKNEDGTPWDPLGGIYRKNMKSEGMGFETSGMWQADWTMNEGSFYRPEDYPNPPRGARMRLTMAADRPTRVVTAYTRGPARNSKDVLLQQDFVEVLRRGDDLRFVSAYDPIAVGGEAYVLSVEVLPEVSSDGSRVTKVTTRDGTDWFLSGGSGFEKQAELRKIGPFETDAAFAVVRVRGREVTHAMFTGGTRLNFREGGVSAKYLHPGGGVFHEVKEMSADTPAAVPSPLTDAIEESPTQPEEAASTTPVEPVTKPETKSLWQKFLDFFR